MRQGVLVISLDFEMMWGNAKWTAGGYGRTNVAHVREVFDRMLPLLAKYGISITVAAVGLVMQDGSKSVIRQNRDLYFAPDIIEKLKACHNVEIASHTYSHFHCMAEGQTSEMFEADLSQAVDAAKTHGIRLYSLVFPGNEVNEHYFDVCVRHGFKCYRGCAAKFFRHKSTVAGEYLQRLCRFLDSYVNLGGASSYALHHSDDAFVNIRASRFVRPYNRLFALFEPLRLRRIRKEMEHAARHGEVYHLWWHPHNMGADIDKNMAFVENIFATFAQCREQYGMRSMTMHELAGSLTSFSSSSPSRPVSL